MKRFLLATTFLTSAAFVTPAAADPVTLLIAAASTGSAVVAGTVALTWTAVATSFMINVALGYALNALTPKPTTGTRTYTVNTLGSAMPTAIIYGQTKIGGVVFYQETTDDNTRLHRLIALAGHEVEEIGDVYLNDELLTLNGSGAVTAPAKYVGKVRIIKHLGTDSQAADTDLVSESDGLWTADHRARGVAYIYARFNFDADAFPNGVPIVTVVVKGRKIYDPRTSTTAYSNNAALCLRDYLLLGGIADATEINETLFSAAANTCDESVTLDAGGTESRYTTSGSATTDGTPSSILSAILASMGGMVWYSQGQWGCKAAAYTTPVLTLDEDDLRSGLAISTRNSRRDGFNKVTGIFRGAESNWQETNYPEIASATFLSVDGGLESSLELNLPFTSSSATAQRIAKIALHRNREQLKISGSFGLRALQLTVGDLVQITNSRLGFSSKVFEVAEWSFGVGSDMALVVNMSLQEISSGVFDWDADEAAFESNNTNLLSPHDVPAVGVSLSQELRVIAEHLSNVIRADVTATSPERVDTVQSEFKLSSDSTWTSMGSGSLGVFEVIDVPDGVYDIRARAINSLGVKGDWNTTSNYTVEGLAAPPADVTEFEAEVNGGQISLSWDAVADLDLSYYMIRYAEDVTGATWAAAVTLVDKVSRPATSISVPARGGTYMIRAYDKLGIGSNNFTSAVVPHANVPPPPSVQYQTENPTYTGTKTACSVIASSLRITDPSSAPSEATYEFSAAVDHGSVALCDVGIELFVARHDNSAGQWDDMSGDWDSWVGNWDDWTGGTPNIADHTVVKYVAATDDDPASTPTWGAWQKVQAAKISGRGFKFKVVLKSTANNITPSITGLRASVGV